MIANPNSFSKVQLEMFPIQLLDEKLDNTESEVHLGIHRNPKDKSSQTIKAKIKCSRRSTNAMMGAGLHGLNGLNPCVSKKLIETYIIPKLLHGLDGVILTDREIAELETYYRNLLKQSQHMSKNTANEIV